MSADWINKLYFGDNLPILREYVQDESVDLIYLDPPFNSKATYNVLFAEKNGTKSQAQIKAFDDTWHWGVESEEVYREIVTTAPGKLPDLISSLREFLGRNDMMAYLVMMAIRLVELRRVLKPTGSIYLHCDPTASHYLKLVMDAVFGAQNFRNDIQWLRSTPHGTAKRKFGVACDNILFFTKSAKSVWQSTYGKYRPEYVEKYYSLTDDTGRRFQPTSLLGHRGVNPEYEWRGIRRHWRYPARRLDELDGAGLIYWPKQGGMPRFKRYLDEQKGQPILSLWTDIPPVNSQAAERLGYPTQKPEALLERIIQASSNEGDLVLDPFCGCGTTIAVAERLKRRWIGIDITHLAIALMRNRLRDAFTHESTRKKAAGRDLAPYEVIGDPQDRAGARALAEEDRYQFEWWALGKVEARPAQDKRKGADTGIDGHMNFLDDPSGKPKKIIVQVKSGHVAPTQVRDLAGVLDREKAAMGVFITLEEPTGPMRAAAAAAGAYESEYWGKRYARLQILTIEEILNGKPVEHPPTPATFKQAPRRTKKTHEEPPLAV